VDWLLHPLTDAERSAVLRAARRRELARGEVVFREGDPADAVHLVLSGHLAVSVSTSDGERATLNVVGPGSHVGELALLTRDAPAERSATVVALEPSVTRVLTATAFRELCARHPAVQGILVDLMAARIRELSTRLLEVMYVGLDRRLVHSLLQLTDIYPPQGGHHVIPLTQEQLADLVGGTRPSVNQVLQRLASEGVLTLGRGRVVVRDVGALRSRAVAV
jgi:CRP-like cAMP-binding protein